ncbi:hypothetical protein ABKN59_004884 [Abortiporus biennis]
MSVKPIKNSLEIRLAESVVFLRAGDATGRTRNQINAPPAMLRGLLTMTLVKPTKITSIDIELVCKTSTAWPEGVGARRIDITEEHKTYEQSYVFFDACAAQIAPRRTLSVGPGLYLDRDRDDLDRSENSSENNHDTNHSPGSSEEETRGRGLTREVSRGRPHRRITSVDQTNYQPGFISHHNTQIPTPPYSPRYSPTGTPMQSLSRTTSLSQRSPAATAEEVSPAQSLEEFRRALRAGLESQLSIPGHARDPSTSGLSLDATSSIESAVHSPIDPPQYQQLSLDEESEFIVGSSSQATQQPPTPTFPPPRSRSQSQAPVERPPSVPSSRATSPTATAHDYRGRKNKRFSLANVSTAFLDAVKSVRSPSAQAREPSPPPTAPRQRARTRESSPTGHPSPVRGRTMDSRTTIERHKSALGRMGEVLGIEAEDSKVYGDGWKEFKPGVYTYPISFAIPVNSSPSISCEYGSVIWRLKAYAHRPGAFKQKLAATQDVTVVACPSEDETEDTESIIVERQWDNQMQYLLTISGRSFPIGGTLPVSLTFMPWTKMKIYRVAVLIEERIDYLTQFKRVARTDTINRIPLLTLQVPQKDVPLLPLQSEEYNALMHSPLREILHPEDDISDATANFMGPGPWVLQKDLQLPKSCEVLHFTNKNKRSNIMISHLLKIIFRVQRGDDRDVDPNTGKRKLYDIVVQTPVHILSCLCRPDFTSLPPYSTSSEAALVHASCRCARNHRSQTGLASPPITPSGSGTSLPMIQTNLTAPSRHLDRHSSGHSVSTLTSVEINNGHHSSSPSRHHSGHSHSSSYPDTAYDRSVQYERLITGQETEEGEAPPSYEAVTLQEHIVINNASTSSQSISQVSSSGQ